jgi:hypothetical protein
MDLINQYYFQRSRGNMELGHKKGLAFQIQPKTKDSQPVSNQMIIHKSKGESEVFRYATKKDTKNPMLYNSALTPLEAETGDRIFQGINKYPYTGNNPWEVFQSDNRMNPFGGSSTHDATHIPRYSSDMYFDSVDKNYHENAFNYLAKGEQGRIQYFLDKGYTVEEAKQKANEPQYSSPYFDLLRIPQGFVDSRTGKPYRDLHFMDLSTLPDTIDVTNKDPFHHHSKKLIAEMKARENIQSMIALGKQPPPTPSGYSDVYRPNIFEENNETVPDVYTPDDETKQEKTEWVDDFDYNQVPELEPYDTQAPINQSTQVLQTPDEQQIRRENLSQWRTTVQKEYPGQGITPNTSDMDRLMGNQSNVPESLNYSSLDPIQSLEPIEPTELDIEGYNYIIESEIEKLNQKARVVRNEFNQLIKDRSLLPTQEQENEKISGDIKVNIQRSLAIETGIQNIRKMQATTNQRYQNKMQSASSISPQGPDFTSLSPVPNTSNISQHHITMDQAFETYYTSPVKEERINQTVERKLMEELVNTDDQRSISTDYSDPYSHSFHHRNESQLVTVGSNHDLLYESLHDTEFEPIPIDIQQHILEATRQSFQDSQLFTPEEITHMKSFFDTEMNNLRNSRLITDDPKLDKVVEFAVNTMVPYLLLPPSDARAPSLVYKTNDLLNHLAYLFRLHPIETKWNRQISPKISRIMLGYEHTQKKKKYKHLKKIFSFTKIQAFRWIQNRVMNHMNQGGKRRKKQKGVRPPLRGDKGVTKKQAKEYQDTIMPIPNNRKKPIDIVKNNVKFASTFTVIGGKQGELNKRTMESIQDGPNIYGRQWDVNLQSRKKYASEYSRALNTN